MGNTIVPVGDGGDEGTSRWMKAAGIAINEEYYRKVANAKDIGRRTYTSRQHQDYLKPEEGGGFGVWEVPHTGYLWDERNPGTTF